MAWHNLGIIMGSIHDNDNITLRLFSTLAFCSLPRRSPHFLNAALFHTTSPTLFLSTQSAFFDFPGCKRPSSNCRFPKQINYVQTCKFDSIGYFIGMAQLHFKFRNETKVFQHFIVSLFVNATCLLKFSWLQTYQFRLSLPLQKQTTTVALYLQKPTKSTSRSGTLTVDDINLKCCHALY